MDWKYPSPYPQDNGGKMKRFLIVLIVIISLGMLWADPMPDFKLTDINNKDIALADILSKGPVIVDFWASWCNPCKTAMPYLNDLAVKYDSLTVVLVSVDAPKDIVKAKNFLKGKDFKFIPLFDSEKILAKKLNVSNVPHTFILDKTGEIVLQHIGFEPGAEVQYEEHVKALLNLPTEAE